MKSLAAKLNVGIFTLGVIGALGFGVTQAAATPTPDPATARSCSECAERCGTIKLCTPSTCQCGGTEVQ